MTPRSSAASPPRPRPALAALALGVLVWAGCGDAAPAPDEGRASVGWERWTADAGGSILAAPLGDKLRAPLVQVVEESIPEHSWLPAGTLATQGVDLYVAYAGFPLVEKADTGKPLAVELRHAERPVSRFAGVLRDLKPNDYAVFDGRIHLALPRRTRPDGGYRVRYWTPAGEVARTFGLVRDAADDAVRTVSASMETRPARPLPLGRSLSTELAVPPGARLHLGVMARGGTGLRAAENGVRIVAAGGDGVGFRLEVGDGRQRRTVWQRFVAPDERDRYLDATVSLAPWAGRRVRLRLSSFSSPEGAPADALDDYAFCSEPFLDVGEDHHRRPNVLLFVVDTLRADALGCLGNPRPLTPNLDALAADGNLFAQARSSSPWTLPAHCSLFTSLLPEQHGVKRSDQRLSHEFETLASVLAERGWRTAAFSDGAFVSATYGLDRGFGRFDARGGGIDKVLERLSRFVDDTSGPWFVFGHTYQVHSPYRPPEAMQKRWIRPYAGRLPDTIETHFLSHPEALSALDARHIHDVYEACVAFVDQRLGRFFEHMRQHGAWDDTLVVVTADHGEEFGEHGGFEHGFTLYEELLRVPLIVRFPGRFRGGRRWQHPVRLIDVPATVLDVLGVPAPDAWTGIPLDRGAGERDLLATLIDHGHAIWDREGRMKWITMRGGVEIKGRAVGPGQLFDLREDPGEHHDLWTEKLDRPFRTTLEQLLGRYADLRSGDQLLAEPSAAERAILQGLGYVR